MEIEKYGNEEKEIYGTHFEKTRYPGKAGRLEKFDSVSLFGIDLSGWKFTQCRFEHCYLRKASFKGSVLVGSTFIDCNLKECDFSGADVRFASFERCKMDEVRFFDDVARGEDHADYELACNLMQNAKYFGKKQEYVSLFKESKKVLLQRYGQYVFSKKEYYRNTWKSASPRKKAFLVSRYLKEWISHVFWNHGIGIWNLLGWELALILFFALVFFGNGLRLGDSLYFSAISISTLGWHIGTENAPLAIRGWIAAESLLGALMTGLIAGVTMNRFSHFNV